MDVVLDDEGTQNYSSPSDQESEEYAGYLASTSYEKLSGDSQEIIAEDLAVKLSEDEDSVENVFTNNISGHTEQSGTKIIDRSGFKFTLRPRSARSPDKSSQRANDANDNVKRENDAMNIEKNEDCKDYCMNWSEKVTNEATDNEKTASQKTTGEKISEEIPRVEKTALEIIVLQKTVNKTSDVEKTANENSVDNKPATKKHPSKETAKNSTINADKVKYLTDNANEDNCDSEPETDENPIIENPSPAESRISTSSPSRGISDDNFFKIMEMEDDNTSKIIQEIRELKCEFLYKLEQAEDKITAVQKETGNLKDKLGELEEKLGENVIVVGVKDRHVHANTQNLVELENLMKILKNTVSATNARSTGSKRI